MSYSISRKTLEIVKLATMEAKELECKRITVDLIAKFFFRDENVKRIVLKYYSAKELTNIIEQLDSFISKKERIPSELIDKMKNLHQEIGMPGYSSGSLNLFQDANRIATQYDKIERIFLHSLFLALIRDDSGESYPLTIFKGREGQSIYDELRQIESDELQNIEEESEFDEDEEWKNYTTDLLKEAKTYDKPFIGREDLIETMLRILARKEKSNPVCIGEPGVGKTAIVYGLAKRILNGDVPDKLKNAKFYSVDMAGMIAGTRFRGEFEERLKMVLNHMEQEENVILFFDEIHTLVGAGSAGGSAMDASNILKPYLTNRKIKFIGATTNEEYRTYIEKDNALERRFQPVIVEEPSVEDAIKILMGLKPAYEKYHNVTYRKKAIESAVKLSAKYIQDRFLPDKAIDIMDDAGAEFSIHPEKGKVITEKDIEDVMSRLYKNIRIEAEDKEMKQLKSLDKSLKSVVFGQDNAVSEIVQAIKISKTGLG